MIYFYSATGNSQWVAQTMAGLTSDKAVSITDIECAKADRPQAFGPGDVLGLVFPVYAWSAPQCVLDFVKRLRVSKYTFVYVIVTCESEAGYVFSYIRPYLKIDSRYVIYMPNDFVIWGGYDTGADYNDYVIKRATEELKDIAKDINARVPDTYIEKGPHPLYNSFVLGPLFKKTASDKKFYATDKCIHCATCASVCPVSDIKMVNGRPEWQHQGCTQCCACINYCPVEAIQHGNITNGGPRYVFPERKYSKRA